MVTVSEGCRVSHQLIFGVFHSTADTDPMRLGPMRFFSCLHRVKKEWSLAGYGQTKSCAVRENRGSGGGKKHVKAMFQRPKMYIVHRLM